jgi:AbiJ N-terminal domain 4
MTSNQSYVPFSQRTGLRPMPPQMQLGKISDELRRKLSYYVDLEFDSGSSYSMESSYFQSKLKRVTNDIHVLFLKQPNSTYENDTEKWKRILNVGFQTKDVGLVFDLVEFLLRHPNCSSDLKLEFADAFVTARAAYRIVDNQVVAIGVEEQGAAFERALADAEQKGAGAARTHLVAAGKALRDADWSGCVRESIHAVESIARQLTPDASTLRPALAALESKGHLHGGLKAAFNSLYGYSSDEEGVRHSLVFNDAAKVDEADALFMLGACASFVSYLAARGTR